MAKQYISIIRLFDHCSVSYDGEVNPSRLKKQLAAEFDFAPTGIIEIDGYHYNKNDVFEEVENTAFVQRLVCHKAIWTNKAILAVLEDNAFDFYEFKGQLKQLQNDEVFENFFSPYFSIPFNYISRTFLNEYRFQGLSDLLLFEEFLKPEDREEGFRSIRIFFHENKRVLKNISEATFDQVQPQVAHWAMQGWSSFLNNLPPEFYDDKSDIAFYLISLTVKIQKSHKKMCKAISRELTKVSELPYEISETISKNDRIYQASPASGNYGWIIWVVIILMRILVKC